MVDVSEKYARKKRDEAKELARNQDIEELAEEALTEGTDAEGLPDGKPEPTFEQ